MDGENNPAAVLDAPVETVTTETPNVEAQTVEQPASASSVAETQAQEPAKDQPDYKALITDPEVRKALLADKETRKALLAAEEAQAEIHHRAQSEAGRRFQEWQQKEDEKRRQDDEKRKQEELDRLLDEDPATYIDKVKENKDKEKAQAALLKREQAVAEGLLGEIDAGIFVPLFATLPGAAQTRLQDREYQGNHVQSRRAYVEDLLNELVEHRTEEKVKKEKEAWEKKDRPAMREALRKEILAEINGGEETPDLGSGSHGNGKITWAEVERHRGDQEWFNEHYEELNALSKR